jgi:hypothetical protein
MAGEGRPRSGRFNIIPPDWHSCRTAGIDRAKFRSKASLFRSSLDSGRANCGYRGPLTAFSSRQSKEAFGPTGAFVGPGKGPLSDLKAANAKHRRRPRSLLGVESDCADFLALPCAPRPLRDPNSVFSGKSIPLAPTRFFDPTKVGVVFENPIGAKTREVPLVTLSAAPVFCLHA